MTIPNGLLAAGTIVNLTSRDRFLFNPKFGVRFETTADQLTFIVDEIRKTLILHPRVFQDSHRAHFAGFGPSSLDIEVLAWVVAADYHEYTATAEELNFAIARVVERAGTSFAFPSQRSTSAVTRNRRRSAPPRSRARWRRGASAACSRCPSRRPASPRRCAAGVRRQALRELAASARAAAPPDQNESEPTRRRSRGRPPASPPTPRRPSLPGRADGAWRPSPTPAPISAPATTSEAQWRSR